MTRSIAWYDKELYERERFTARLSQDFARALREGQFQVFYQPRFDIQGTPRLSSAEALVRWTHPELGRLSPGQFIPDFEKNGLIEELDLFVWHEAAAQVCRWKEIGLGVPVSLNVSRVDLYDPGLADKFAQLLEEYQLDSSLLLLEVTESAYSEDPDSIMKSIQRLKDRSKNKWINFCTQ